MSGKKQSKLSKDMSRSYRRLDKPQTCGFCGLRDALIGVPWEGRIMACCEECLYSPGEGTEDCAGKIRDSVGPVGVDSEPVRRASVQLPGEVSIDNSFGYFW